MSLTAFGASFVIAVIGNNI